MFDFRLFQLLALFCAVSGCSDLQQAVFFVPIIAAFGIISQAAAGIYAAVSARQNAKTAAKQAEDTAAYNAQVAKNEAEQERLNRKAEESAERKDMLRRRAAIEAAYAKSGVLIEGTPAYYLSQQAGVDEVNVQRGNQASLQRQRQLTGNALLTSVQGKNAAGAYRAQGQAALVGGMMQTVGQTATTAAWAGQNGYLDWMK